MQTDFFLFSVTSQHANLRCKHLSEEQTVNTKIVNILNLPFTCNLPLGLHIWYIVLLQPGVAKAR